MAAFMRRWPGPLLSDTGPIDKLSSAHIRRTKRCPKRCIGQVPQRRRWAEVTRRRPDCRALGTSIELCAVASQTTAQSTPGRPTRQSGQMAPVFFKRALDEHQTPDIERRRKGSWGLGRNRFANDYASGRCQSGNTRACTERHEAHGLQRKSSGSRSAAWKQ